MIKLSKHLKSRLYLTALVGSLPLLMGILCQLYWSFNTHMEPVRWEFLPGLTFILIAIFHIGFEAGDSFHNLRESKEEK